MTVIDINIDKFPTIVKMTESKAYVKFIIGPAGSGKTSGCIKELIVRSMQQAPNAQGIRYTRWMVVRNTYNMLTTNTIPSMKNFLGTAVHFSAASPPKGHGIIPLPDGTVMDIEFIFLSLDSDDAVNKLLGSDITGALLDEISELPEIIIDAVVSRTGRYPAMHRGKPTWVGVVGATNGPNENHWLYEWQEARATIEQGTPNELAQTWLMIEENMKRPFFHLFQQPPALLRPVHVGDDWIPNPDAENIENLMEGYSYYFKMLSQTEERIQAYVEGVFSPIKTGAVIFQEFQKRLHVVPRRDIKFDGSVPVLLSFDFGRTPVMVVAFTNKHGGLVIVGEFTGIGMGIATLWDTVAKPGLVKAFKHYEIVAAYGDPAGESDRDTLDISPFGVLLERGVPIYNPWGFGNRIDFRIEAVSRRLKTLDPDGYPMLMVADNCTLTIQAFTKGYVWETKDPENPEKAKDYPTKTHKGHASDLMDAVQYLCLGHDSGSRTSRKRDSRVPEHSHVNRRAK